MRDPQVQTFEIGYFVFPYLLFNEKVEQKIKYIFDKISFRCCSLDMCVDTKSRSFLVNNES